MATVSINASARTDFGKSAARKIRFAGQLPGVVYRAGAAATHIALDRLELENAFRKTMNRNTLVELSVDGDTKTCLVRDTQRDPVSKVLLHIDFYELDLKEKVEVKVPVRTEGTAKGMTIGGKLRLIRRDLKLRCVPSDIPESVVVDITNVDMDEYIKVGDLTAPDNTEFVAEDNFNVLAIVGRRVAVADAVVEGDEDAEGAEGAADEASADAGAEESGE